MFMKKRILLPIIAVCMLLLFLTACKSGIKDKSKKTGSSSNASTPQSSYYEAQPESESTDLESAESNTSSKKGNKSKPSGKNSASSSGTNSSKSASSKTQSGNNGAGTGLQPGEIDESLNGEWI